MATDLGPITQTCWVVPDLAVTEAFMSEHLGVPRWMRIPDVHFGPDTCTYRGAPADFTAHVSLAYLGDMQLELIEPVRGDSIYSDFLTRSGGGLHHVCFEPDDFDAAVTAFTADGMPPVQAGTMAGMMRFAYVDGGAHGVPYVELAEIGPDMRALFDSLRSSAD